MTRNFSKNWDATICVLAAPAAGFKKCCMASGLFDGSRRNYLFPRIKFSPVQRNFVFLCTAFFLSAPSGH